jgi:two-component system, OmpR family, response regulator
VTAATSPAGKRPTVIVDASGSPVSGHSNIVLSTIHAPLLRCPSTVLLAACDGDGPQGQDPAPGSGPAGQVVLIWLSCSGRDDGRVRVLVVDDDVRMASAIRRGLRYEGLVVDVAGDGEEALRTAGATDYDVIVLDVLMPGLDGFETCRRLRADGLWTPVLMLTARDSVEDRVRGLDGGADDYLTKPFSLAELTARLRALVRRGPGERPAVLEAGDLRLDPATREVRRGEVEIALSAREFALLETFMRRPGQVFSHLQLLEAAWDLGYEQRSNVVEVYVRYLRQKIDRPFGVRSLETVRGAGYRLRGDGGT